MRRPSLSSAVSLGISIVAIGAVAYWITQQEQPQFPDDAAGFAWLAAGLAISAVTFTLRGWRWHRVMRLSGIPHRRRDAYGLTLVAYMGNTVLPARGGELLKIGLLGNRTTARRREILGSVIAERLLDAVTLGILFVGLAAVEAEGLPEGHGSAIVVGVVLAVLAALLAGYLRLRRAGRFERFADTVRPVARASKIFARPQGIPLVALSVLLWCFEGLTFACIARSVEVELTPVASLSIVVIASLFAAIPAAPGFAGTFDAGIVLGLKAAGVAGGQAVGVLVLARIIFFAPVTLIGLLVLWFGYGGLRPVSRGLVRASRDGEELLPEEPPRERRPQVAAGEPRAGR
jgi:uncharacterized membrane protein YbhN (UPF0104 family)